jgi:hypothetical protein
MADEADPRDPLAAMRAGIDQAIAGQPEVARMLHGVYVANVAAGFSVSQAFALTRDLYRHVLAFGGDEADG